jgi:hypothetical protein
LVKSVLAFLLTGALGDGGVGDAVSAKAGAATANSKIKETAFMNTSLFVGTIPQPQALRRSGDILSQLADEVEWAREDSAALAAAARPGGHRGDAQQGKSPVAFCFRAFHRLLARHQQSERTASDTIPNRD